MLIIAAGLFLILPVGAALAQDTEAVTTTLQVENPETGEREPVEGVSFTVTDAAGNEVGTGTTDAEGVFLLEVPEPGTYQMLLDDSTLPEGIASTTRTGTRRPCASKPGRPGRPSSPSPPARGEPPPGPAG